MPFMLNVTYKPFMLSVIILSVVYAELPSVIKLNVVMLSVIILNVVAPAPFG
jgi:hypothetical protein